MRGTNTPNTQITTTRQPNKTIHTHTHKQHATTNKHNKREHNEHSTQTQNTHARALTSTPALPHDAFTTHSEITTALHTINCPHTDGHTTPPRRNTRNHTQRTAHALSCSPSYPITMHHTLVVTALPPTSLHLHCLDVAASRTHARIRTRHGNQSLYAACTLFDTTPCGTYASIRRVSYPPSGVTRKNEQKAKSPKAKKKEHQ